MHSGEFFRCPCMERGMRCAGPMHFAPGRFCIFVQADGKRRCAGGETLYFTHARIAVRVLNQELRRPGADNEETLMLTWSILFLVIAIVAAIFGFWAVAGAAAFVAKILFVVFLVLFLISMLARAMRGNRPPV